MQVEFDATIDDFVDVAMRSVEGSKALRAWRWEGALTSATLIGVCTYVIVRGAPVSKLAAGVVTFVVVTVVNLASFKSSHRRRTRRLAKELIRTEGAPVRIKVEITKSGITFDQRKTQQIHDWSTIERYDETDDAIYFWTRDHSALAVRKRAFESRDSQDRFIELAKSYMQAHPVQ